MNERTIPHKFVEAYMVEPAHLFYGGFGHLYVVEEYVGDTLWVRMIGFVTADGLKLCSQQTAPHAAGLRERFNPYTVVAVL